MKSEVEISSSPVNQTRKKSGFKSLLDVFLLELSAVYDIIFGPFFSSMMEVYSTLKRETKHSKGMEARKRERVDKKERFVTIRICS